MDHSLIFICAGGDPKNPPKDAPSALHSVIVPNVNLPKVWVHSLAGIVHDGKAAVGCTVLLEYLLIANG